MVTCEQCGKINGYGQMGTSWICADCKIGEVAKTSNIDGTGKAESEKKNQGRSSGQVQNETE